MNNDEQKSPIVYAVIVTWNKKKDVLKLLDQLVKIRYSSRNCGIVVVDNDSSDGTAEAIRSLHPSVNLIVNHKNLGGSGGFNTGMRWVLQNRHECKYVWLLDNDVLVHPDALSALVSIMEQNPEAAICGSKILNIEAPNELIEVGAFIDYRIGDIWRNLPEPSELENPDSVFEVDYVAGCSLLARTELLKKLGLWKEDLFIYWDDMEWGARFKASGYKVLAANASIVYHPSWEGRTFYHSAIWRYYYRVRNALWFFNNYHTGIGRRLLLSRLIMRFMRFALCDGMRSNLLLSQSFARGVKDFFLNRYGKKEFRIPPHDLERFSKDQHAESICVFVIDSETADAAAEFIGNLLKRTPEVRVFAIVPATEKTRWKEIARDGDILTCTRSKNGSFSLSDKYRIYKFLKDNPWDLLVTSLLVPRIGAIWGKAVARVDFENESTVAIEKMDFRDVCRIPLLTFLYLVRVLVYPPHRSWQ